MRVQAFVETYADKIIDATLGGDQQAADELLQSDTFLQALQSGLTGGASGAPGRCRGHGAGRHEPDAGCPGRGWKRLPRCRWTPRAGRRCRGSAAGIGRAGHGAGEAARQQADQAAAVQQTDNANAAETTAQKDAAPAVRSENPAVQQLAAALQAWTT